MVPKFVPKLGCYRRRKSHEDCIVVLSIYDRCEYVSAAVTGGVFAHVTSWVLFNEEFEPSQFDQDKVCDMLKRRAKRVGISDRAQELLNTLDDARNQPEEGEVHMATKKSAAKPAKPAEKKVAKPAEKKVAPVEKAAGPGRKSAFNDDMKIKVLAKENPKRAGAAARFALYKDGMSVGEYIKAGGLMADVRWDVKQGFISVK